MLSGSEAQLDHYERSTDRGPCSPLIRLLEQFGARRHLLTPLANLILVNLAVVVGAYTRRGIGRADMVADGPGLAAPRQPPWCPFMKDRLAYYSARVSRDVASSHFGRSLKFNTPAI